MNNFKIKDMEWATRKVLHKLSEEGIATLDIKPLNKGRYLLVECSDKNRLIMFKRDFFMSYGKMFSDQGASGIGDTINTEDLQLAIKKKAKEIISIFDDGVVYRITIQKLLENSIAWENKERKKVRSFSIHLYDRLMDLNINKVIL